MPALRSFFQYTLDLFGPPALVEPAQVATEVIASLNPGVDHELTQSLSQVIAPASYSHPQANRQLRLGDAVVAYLFKRAKRRTIGFVVGPDGLVVRAPRWTPVTEVEAALREKGPWVTRKLDEARQRQQRQQAARVDWADGTMFPLFGLLVLSRLATEKLRGCAEGRPECGYRHVHRAGLGTDQDPGAFGDRHDG